VQETQAYRQHLAAGGRGPPQPRRAWVDEPADSSPTASDSDGALDADASPSESWPEESEGSDAGITLPAEAGLVVRGRAIPIQQPQQSSQSQPAQQQRAQQSAAALAREAKAQRASQRRETDLNDYEGYDEIGNSGTDASLGEESDDYDDATEEARVLRGVAIAREAAAQGRARQSQLAAGERARAAQQQQRQNQSLVPSSSSSTDVSRGLVMTDAEARDVERIILRQHQGAQDAFRACPELETLMNVFTRLVQFHVADQQTPRAGPRGAVGQGQAAQQPPTQQQESEDDATSGALVPVHVGVKRKTHPTAPQPDDEPSSKKQEVQASAAQVAAADRAARRIEEMVRGQQTRSPQGPTGTDSEAEFDASLKVFPAHTSAAPAAASQSAADVSAEQRVRQQLEEHKQRYAQLQDQYANIQNEIFSKVRHMVAECAVGMVCCVCVSLLTFILLACVGCTVRDVIRRFTICCSTSWCLSRSTVRWFVCGRRVSRARAPSAS
jgi:hypothetical protein